MPEQSAPVSESAEVFEIASHRYRWKVSEIVSMIGIVAVPLGAVLLVAESGKALLLPALGVLGAVMLFYIGSSRKRASALSLREEDGVWRLYKGGTIGSPAGTTVHIEQVNVVGVLPGEFGDPSILLAVDDERGERVESLSIPSRLLAASPLLREEVAGLLAEHGDASTRERAAELLA